VKRVGTRQGEGRRRIERLQADGALVQRTARGQRWLARSRRRRPLLGPHAELLVVLPVRRLAVPAAVEGGLAPSALVEGDAAVAVSGAAVGAQVGLGVEGGGITLLFARMLHGL